MAAQLAELTLLKEQNYKFSKQLLAQQSSSAAATSIAAPLLTIDTASAPQPSKIDSFVSPSHPLPPAVHAVPASPAVFADRTNLTPLSSSLASMLQLKQQGKTAEAATPSATHKAKPSASLLTDLINRK